jgi:hypothetical protein
MSLEKAKPVALLDQLVDTVGACLNVSLEAAANEPLPASRVFTQQNWSMTKTCLAGIRAGGLAVFHPAAGDVEREGTQPKKLGR